MSEDLADIVRAVSDAAKGGDMQAAKIILDRLAPVRRGRPVQFTAPGGGDAKGLAEALDNVVSAIATGDMTPEEGAAVATVLEARRKIIETMEIEARLTALDKRAV